MSILEFEKTKVFHQRSSSKLLLWTNTIKRLFNFSQVDLEHKLYDSRRHTQWIPVFHNHCWFQKLCFSLSDNYHCYEKCNFSFSDYHCQSVVWVFGKWVPGPAKLCKVFINLICSFTFKHYSLFHIPVTWWIWLHLYLSTQLVTQIWKPGRAQSLLSMQVPWGPNITKDRAKDPLQNCVQMFTNIYKSSAKVRIFSQI